MRALAPLAVLASIAIAPRAFGEAPAYDDRACARCHGDFSRRAHVHTAVSSGHCADCHQPFDQAGKCQGAVAKGWKLVAPDPALCQTCHDMKGKAPPHPIIEAMGCTACHDPHGSANPAQLKEWPVARLCSGCHDRKDAKKEVHTAVKRGDCLGCHDPHAGEAAPLLRRPRSELCASCHPASKVAKGRAVHTAVSSGACLGCHDPHASDNPQHLLRTGDELCLACHGAKGAGTARGSSLAIDLSKKDVHPAIDGAGCAGCHAAHSSPWAKQLLQPLPALCYGCHDRKDATEVVHGAVRLGRCDACHDPHASANDRLLRDARAADLCFRCHADDVNARKHVHTPVAKGECLACHQPHGSANAKNLEKAVPALCLGCHPQRLAKKNVHPAVTRSGCTACHDPHGSANEAQLLAAGNELCLKCHARITGDHVFVSFDGKSHPLSGKPDPSRPGKTLACVSCHDAHASDNPQLFVKGTSKMEICSNCHAKH